MHKSVVIPPGSEEAIISDGDTRGSALRKNHSSFQGGLSGFQGGPSGLQGTFSSAVGGPRRATLIPRGEDFGVPSDQGRKRSSIATVKRDSGRKGG